MAVAVVRALPGSDACWQPSVPVRRLRILRLAHTMPQSRRPYRQRWEAVFLMLVFAFALVVQTLGMGIARAAVRDWPGAVERG